MIRWFTERKVRLTGEDMEHFLNLREQEKEIIDKIHELKGELSKNHLEQLRLLRKAPEETSDDHTLKLVVKSYGS